MTFRLRVASTRVTAHNEMVNPLIRLAPHAARTVSALVSPLLLVSLAALASLLVCAGGCVDRHLVAQDLVSGSCSGVTCSGHGTCAVRQGRPLCDCNPGFHVVGSTACVDDAMGDGGTGVGLPEGSRRVDDGELMPVPQHTHLSPDGRYVVFMAARSRTGEGRPPFDVVGVKLWDTTTGDLRHLSDPAVNCVPFSGGRISGHHASLYPEIAGFAPSGKSVVLRWIDDDVWTYRRVDLATGRAADLPCFGGFIGETDLVYCAKAVGKATEVWLHDLDEPSKDRRLFTLSTPYQSLQVASVGALEKNWILAINPLDDTVSAVSIEEDVLRVIGNDIMQPQLMYADLSSAGYVVYIASDSSAVAARLDGGPTVNWGTTFGSVVGRVELSLSGTRAVAVHRDEQTEGAQVKLHDLVADAVEDLETLTEAQLPQGRDYCLGDDNTVFAWHANGTLRRLRPGRDAEIIAESLGSSPVACHDQAVLYVESRSQAIEVAFTAKGDVCNWPAFTSQSVTTETVVLWNQGSTTTIEGLVSGPQVAADLSFLIGTMAYFDVQNGMTPIPQNGLWKIPLRSQ